MDSQKDRIREFEERVFNFSKSIIYFSKKIPTSPINNPIINQLVRSSTSIGANYAEANASQSTKDFIHKAEIARKESRESDYWLSILQVSAPQLSDEIVPLREEVISIFKILGSMCKKSKQRLENKKKILPESRV